MALIPTGQVPDDYRRKLAYKLMMEGTDASPVQHWAQGLARMGQGALGGYEMYQADQKDKETEAGNNSALVAALQAYGGGAPAASAPSPQPTPQQPTAQPTAPVSSVTPSAGAVPAALSGARPGGPVMPSNKVWGDAEAEAAGIYEKPAAGPKIAANGPVALPPQPAAPMVPTPVKPEAIAPAPAAPTQPDPQRQAAVARLAEMLRSDNPQMRKVGSSMAQQFLQGEMAREFKPPETTDEIKEYNLYKKQGGPLNFFDYKSGLKKAGATNVTTTVGGGSDKQIFDALDESAKEARATASGLTGLREARAAIQGGAITGAGADQRLALQKIGALVGVADPTKITNTETFRAAIAPQVAAVLKSTVGTANISNTDREFAEKAAGGSITLDEKSISRLMDIMERASIGRLEAHQKKVEKIYSDPEKFGRERALFGVDIPAAPAATAPSGSVVWERGPDGKPRRKQ